MGISTQKPWSAACASSLFALLLSGACLLAIASADDGRPAALISPAAAQDDVMAGRPILFIDAASESPLPPPQADLKRVYYSSSLSIRAATNAVRRDQNQGLTAQRLTGTPLDWAEHDLNFSLNLRSKPSLVTANELAEAFADEVDVQIVDLRGASENVGTSSVSASALRLLPHEFEAALSEISRRRWLVLVDGGNGVANSLAQLASERGYVLVAVLEGGYPAWIANEA